MSSRVELLPQSKAAIASATNILELKYFNLQRRSDELSDGVIRAHQKVRQMSVQALHPNPGTTDSPTRLYEVIANRRGPAAPGVVIVSSLKFVVVDECLKAVDPALTFQPTHRVM